MDLSSSQAIAVGGYSYLVPRPVKLLTRPSPNANLGNSAEEKRNHSGFIDMYLEQRIVMHCQFRSTMTYPAVFQPSSGLPNIDICFVRIK